MPPKKEEVWRNFRMSLEIFEGLAFCCIKHSYRSDILKPVILLLREWTGKAASDAVACGVAHFWEICDVLKYPDPGIVMRRAGCAPRLTQTSGLGTQFPKVCSTHHIFILLWKFIPVNLCLYLQFETFLCLFQVCS